MRGHGGLGYPIHRVSHMMQPQDRQLYSECPLAFSYDRLRVRLADRLRVRGMPADEVVGTIQDFAAHAADSGTECLSGMDAGLP